MSRHSCSRIPEISILFLSFFLNFFWEVAQTHFYTMNTAPFHTMLYGWVHCTLGDIILTLVSFWLVSIANRNRRWFLHLNGLNLTGFVVIGLLATVISERVNVHVFKSWAYTQSMPLIPWSEVGLTPLLQWMIIPPVIILLVRHHLLPRSSEK